MKEAIMTSRWIMVLGMAVLGTACRQVGTGTTGSSTFDTGTAHADGSVPYVLGRTRPFQVSGLEDEAFADSRAEASLDTSGAGSAELSRRSAAAEIQGANPPLRAPRNQPSESADQIILDRIHRALSSTTPRSFPISQPYSIQTLHNVRISVHRGVVTLRGPIGSFELKKSLEARVRTVEGVSAVNNELAVQPPPGTAPSGVPIP
jgi:hypothetical protein